jgi:cytochrome c oxidase subunit 2
MPTIVQSALHPAGPQAAHIGWLWWLMFWTCTGVYVLVMIALVLAVRRGRSRDGARPQPAQLLRGVGTATAATIIILLGLLVAAVVTGRAVGSLYAQDALTIEITGYQWWWSVEYDHPEPSLRITTANELHLPVGRPVRITLKSNDVIHSFWVPNLHGKVDIIPGRRNETWIQADTPGVYRGQCAEYCGTQHANMAFHVVALPQEEFDAWLAAPGEARPAPANVVDSPGYRVFLKAGCGQCHAIEGTPAIGTAGPDLTHLGSRGWIAAGMLPNNRGNLAGWVANPQAIKPGAKMPRTYLSGDDLNALVSYLEGLK